MKSLFIDTNRMKYIMVFLAGVILASSCYEFGMWFSDNYRLQPVIVPRDMSPVPDYTPVITAPTEKPVPTTAPKPKTQSRAQIVASSKYPDFIDHIWERESTRGQNKAGLHLYCLEQGKSNEFGFYPSGKHCFSDFTASVRRLEKWYEDNSALTDNQKLCRYNSGIASSTCAYLSYRFEDMN